MALVAESPAAELCEPSSRPLLPMLPRSLPWLRNRHGWVGVDLGSAAVKLAEVERTPDGWALLARHVALRDSVLSKSRWSDASQLVPASVQAHLNSRRWWFDRPAAATVSMSVVDFRSLTLPHARDDELDSLVAQELASEHSGDVQFDWWSPSVEASDQPLKLYAVSLPVDVSRQVGQSLAAAGTVPRILDSLPHALARAAALQAVGAAPVAAVDWGYSCATFLLAAEGMPVFVRQLRGCGLSSWLAAVGQAFELSAEEADQLLRERGAPRSAEAADELDEMLATTTQPLLNHLISELRRTLQFLRTDSPPANPAQLLLFGGGAMLPRVADALQIHLGLPTVPWRLPGSSVSSECEDPLLGAAVGMALLGLTPEARRARHD